ncbi:hypothetical protein M427DRAFT_376027 [Gonapodya prolifera JEL478]|uniref:SH3 domain-containing protein n=1 Tax=Gonapodya prolifera (strain JEL478) TaxID=1344416 RepID=A0A139AV60_GONPJ|nr:hypothetical protein M427DRAFT_376027 [Gonapodya prolifera JEL478]|eukprot:KXS20463.1 hypothetical protein M427DRAFT_376027 [Gonapodya prolifera JEL478]
MEGASDAGNNLHLLRAISSHIAASNDELALRAGDVVILVDASDDGWWLVRDAQGREGFVPRTFLEDEVVGQEGKPADSEWDGGSWGWTDGRSDAGSPTRSVRSFDLTPPSALSSPTTMRSLNLPHLRRRWSSVSERVRSTFGNVPETFAESALGRARREGRGSLSDSLLPTRGFNGTGLTDLIVDPKSATPLPHPVSTTLTLTLHSARNIPIPGPSCRIAARVVRCALWEDGVGLVGNVHTVPAGVSERDSGGTWGFSKKPSLLFPPQDSSTLLVRADSVRPGLCLLIESCVVLERIDLDADDDRSDGNCVELCCAWGLLPLFTSSHLPLPPRLYPVALRGGSPLDSVAAPPPSPAPRSKRKSVWESAVGAVLGGGGVGESEAVVEVRIWGGKKTVEIETLPSPLVCSLRLAPVLAFHRHLVARSVFPPGTPRGAEPNLGARFDAAIALVPWIVDREEAAEVLAKTWEEKRKKAGAAERKSFGTMSRKFKQAVLSVWPLVACADRSADPGWPRPLPTTAQAAIFRSGPVASMGSTTGDVCWRPFDVAEVGWGEGVDGIVRSALSDSAAR